MKSVLLIGLGNFGIQIAKNVEELGHEVMGIDISEDRVNDALPHVANALIGDTTNESFLKSIGVDKFDICIETIGGDFQSSLETVSLLKELGAKKVIARANRDVQAKFLLRNGADEVVNPEKQIARWTAVKYTVDNVSEYLNVGDDHVIIEVKTPSRWVGKKVYDLEIRKKFGINILAISIDGVRNTDITPDEVFEEGSSLLVLGEADKVVKCFDLK